MAAELQQTVNYSFKVSRGNESGQGYDPFSKDSGLSTDLAISGIFFFTFLVVPNSVIVVVLLFGKKFRQPSDWLVLNLSTMHALASVMTAPIALIKYFRGVYPGRQDLCSCQAFFSLLGIFVNLFIITAMSIERYLALGKPFFYRRYIKDSSRAIAGCLSVIWSVSVILSLLPVARIAGKVKLTFSFCHPVWTDQSDDGRAFISVLISSTLLCTLLIICFNIATIRALYRMRRTLRRASSLSIAAPPESALGSPSNSRRPSLVSLLSQRRNSVEFVSRRPNGISAASVRGVSAVSGLPNIDKSRQRVDRRRSSLSTVMESKADRLHEPMPTLPTSRQQFLSGRNSRRMSLPDFRGATPLVTRGIDGHLVELEMTDFVRSSACPLEEEPSPSRHGAERLTASALVHVVEERSHQHRQRSVQLERRRRPSRWRRAAMLGDGQCTRMIIVVTFFFVASITPHVIRIIIEQLTGKNASKGYAIAAQRLLIANSILNPVFYIALRRAYRTAFKNFFRRCCCCKDHAGLPKVVSRKRSRPSHLPKQTRWRPSTETASSHEGLLPRLRLFLGQETSRKASALTSPLSDTNHQLLQADGGLSPASPTAPPEDFPLPSVYQMSSV